MQLLQLSFSIQWVKVPNDSGMSRVHIMQAIDDSLKRLQTDLC